MLFRSNALGVLAVVHGSDAGNEAEQGGEAGIWFSGHGWRRDSSLSCVVRPAAAGIGSASRWCAGSSELGSEAGFTEDGSADDTGTLRAQRFATVLAKGSSFSIRMVCAVHANPPSCLNTLGLRTTRSCVAKGSWAWGRTDSTNWMLPVGVSRRLDPGLGLVCFWSCFWLPGF